MLVIPLIETLKVNLYQIYPPKKNKDTVSHFG